ncbi:ABC transporter C family member 3-like [Rutidosis leptorrhynchoides]|uniref:ABC transporter C family member 3-like n=1 Tax=Rutidosis leptorrhynchoides TaxID=125765 RepID=UPI003A993C04
MMTNTATNFLLNPIFFHGCVALIQFLFLLFILISWVCYKRLKLDTALVPKQSFGCLFYKQTLFCSVFLSLFNLVLCFLNNFYWYRNGWADEKIVSLSHAVLASLIWFSVSVYLHTLGSNSSTNSKKYPFVLRVWWVFFFTVSCCSLLVDYVNYKRTKNAPLMFFVSDSVSSFIGLFLCYVGLSHKTEEEAQSNNLEEPLLNSGVIKGEIQSTYENASFFSLLIFGWMSPIIAKGNKKPLDLEDVPQLASIDSVKRVFPVLLNKVESYSNGGNQITTFGLTKALFYIVWKEAVITGFLGLVSALTSFVGPYFLDSFVKYLNGNRDYDHQGWVLVAAFFISKIIGCFTQRHWYFKLQQAGIRARSATVAMIYKKGLTISGQSKQGNSSGEIINFMAVDAERIGDYAWYMHDFWLVLVQVGIALALLYKNLGVAAVASFVATVFVLLANLPLGNIQEKLQDELMKSKDKRMKSTSEILRNMRILKLQGWEMKFLSKIIKLRDEEEGALKKYMYTLSLTSFIFWGAPIVVAVVTFATCLFVGTPLESGKILSSLATFKILQEPIYNLPDSISVFFQTKVSLDRIATYLRLSDIDSNGVDKAPKGVSDTAIEIINGNFSWDSNESSNPTLKDINIRVNHGMRVAVCGTVGSGKSSLLSCILGEVSKVSGSVKVEGTKAYVAQSPWIQSGKIEDNILFGREMDRERYEKVLEACSLKKDLEILSFGDQTVIGERGINLSGGQKQRIQIARALYQDADIYLFDDPFSAVDAHTGSHLLKECMLQFLDSKTVIYITHQVEFLPAADLILVLRDGKITQAGKYNDILNSGSDFMELVGAHKEALSAIDSMGRTDQEQTDSSQKKPNNTQNNKTEDISGTKAQLVQEEEREKGRVGFSVYWKYITTAYGGALAPFIVLAQVVFQTLQIGSNYWMALASPVSADDPAPVTGSTLIIVYVALSVGSALCILARGLLLATVAYKAATILFHKMHLSIFRSPMSFFDSTPSGRILNRASTDQSAVDMQIPYQVGSFVFAIIQLLAIMAVMSQCSWPMIFVLIPVGGLCIWLQQYYLPSAREMARLVGVCKGPVIQNFAETISGSTTIRSFDQQDRFQNTNLKLNDDFARPKFHAAAAMEWLGLRLDMLSSFTFVAFLIFLISIPEGTIDPSIAGLAVTYGLTLNTLQGWVVWTLTNLENKIISVERIFQYSSIPSEPPLVIESNRPNEQWPSQGEVDIRHLQVRYAPHMPLVLRGLTCTFNGAKKTGIVGRTGSGKSTLIQTLFRLVEPAAGEILIDGINISTIGLHDLRSRLSIIPQDPTMFEGTIRSNLDPLEEYSDDKIWEALDKCQLGDEVRSKEGKLDSPVTENGENWSVGQRQLVCLGRVLLKKTKVLVLDEATASVDTATDGMIQQTLAQHFKDSTVIMIAHRITSVLDSDMVLVLEQGLIDEYDTPTKLLEDKSSSFAKLVAEYSMRSSSSFENLTET